MDDHRTERPCRCGKGKLVTTWKSNDWGDTVGEHEEIACEDCARDFFRVPIWNRRAIELVWLEKSELELHNARLIAAGLEPFVPKP